MKIYDGLFHPAVISNISTISVINFDSSIKSSFSTFIVKEASVKNGYRPSWQSKDNIHLIAKTLMKLTIPEALTASLVVCQIKLGAIIATPHIIKFTQYLKICLFMNKFCAFAPANKLVSLIGPNRCMQKPLHLGMWSIFSR